MQGLIAPSSRAWRPKTCRASNLFSAPEWPLSGCCVKIDSSDGGGDW